MIQEIKKVDAFHLWNNYYQGTFLPGVFEEVLKTNDIILEERWKIEERQIIETINSDLFQKFSAKYNTLKKNNVFHELESFIKEGKEYLRLGLKVDQKTAGFMACFLLDEDYTIQYLCIDGHIEIATHPYTELNTVYNKYKQLIPPPLEFVNEFNRLNAQLSKQTGEYVDRTMYQAWFELTPKVKLDVDFAKAYNTYQVVGDAFFGDALTDDQGIAFEEAF